MKRPLLCLLAFLSGQFFMFSCNEEEATPKDLTSPNITIISPGTSDVLKEVIQIKAEIAEPNLLKVEVFVDAAMIGESTTNSVELTFDTKSVKDGTHILKVVATDKENNQAEATVTLEILNALAIFSVPNSYIDEFEESWIFLTDNDGNVLGVQQAENGKEITFSRPENFKDDHTFVLNEFRFFYKKSESEYETTEINIMSYLDFKPGKYFLLGFENETNEQSTIGEYTLSVTNVANNQAIYALGTNIGNTSAERIGDQYIIKAELQKNNTTILYSTSAPHVYVSSNDVPRYMDI
jgi:hypothetical protein